MRNNFVLVYELLDEAADAGWPQTTDEAALRALVFQKVRLGLGFGIRVYFRVATNPCDLPQGFVTAAARARREAAASASTLQVTPNATPDPHPHPDSHPHPHPHPQTPPSPPQVTGAVGWRKEGIRYKKNEVFLDVVEQASDGRRTTGRG